MSSPVKKNYVELNKEQAFQMRKDSPMRKLQTNVSKHSLLHSTESKVTPVKSKSIPSARIPKKREEQAKEVARVSVDLNTSPTEEHPLEVYRELKSLRPPSKTPNSKQQPKRSEDLPNSVRRRQNESASKKILIFGQAQQADVKHHLIR